MRMSAIILGINDSCALCWALLLTGNCYMGQWTGLKQWHGRLFWHKPMARFPPLTAGITDLSRSAASLHPQQSRQMQGECRATPTHDRSVYPARQATCSNRGKYSLSLPPPPPPPHTHTVPTASQACSPHWMGDPEWGGYLEVTRNCTHTAHGCEKWRLSCIQWLSKLIRELIHALLRSLHLHVWYHSQLRHCSVQTALVSTDTCWKVYCPKPVGWWWSFQTRKRTFCIEGCLSTQPPGFTANGFCETRYFLCSTSIQLPRCTAGCSRHAKRS